MIKMHKEFIKKALEELEKRKIIKTVEKLTHYHDEPKIHYFSAHKYSKKWSTSTGLSFESPELALLRCAGEAIERNVLIDIPYKTLKRASYNELKNEGAMNPNTINENLPNVSNASLLWTRGYEGIDFKKPAWIPAQTIYLDSRFWKTEPHFLPTITTGAAGGFDHEGTLLRAIYEVIERDSLMCVYLTKSRPKKINTSTILSQKIQNILTYLKRYLLEPHIFETTTNIQIPSCLVILIDKSGLGPRITLSAKAGQNIESALCGALEESVLTRQWVRRIITEKYPLPVEVPEKLISFEDRAKFWLPEKMTKHLDFLLTIPETRTIRTAGKKLSVREQLKSCQTLLTKAGYSIYFSSIEHDVCQKLHYRVYKAVIPGLQPLYINESGALYFPTRLRTVAHYFGNNTYILNTIPHPFL